MHTGIRRTMPITDALYRRRQDALSPEDRLREHLSSLARVVGDKNLPLHGRVRITPAAQRLIGDALGSRPQRSRRRRKPISA